MIAGYYVNNVYLVNSDTVLIRLHHSEKPDIRIVLSTIKGVWITKYELPKKSSGIATKLRKEIHRAKIKNIKNPSGERIAIIEFGETPNIRRVILEFFGGGNIIVTDEDGIIRTHLRSLRVKHRTIRIGQKYISPPQRGLDVKSIEIEDILKIKESDLEVSRWFGRNLALSKKYVEEVMDRSEIDSKIKGSELHDDDISVIFKNLKKVVDMVLIGDVEPTVVYNNDEPIDAAPFKLKSYQDSVSKVFKTFLDALDEVHAYEIRGEMNKESLEPLNRKIDEITKSIEKQSRIEKEYRQNSVSLREYAEKIQEKARMIPKTPENITKILLELGASSAMIMKGRLKVAVHGISLKTESNQSLMKIASLIFIEAKNLERKVESITKAQAKLESNLDSLKDKLNGKIIESESKDLQVRTEKMWYERYRWFKTSEGLLAIGGRDASTNTIILGRHTEDNDLVFHADLHGSPFFILKGKEPSKNSIKEVAQAVVLYSRAWKDGFSSASAYWIHPVQVKRNAPSGMYLPKGSFLIQGTKNQIKDLKIECAVGLVFQNGYWIVVSGPPEAIMLNSAAFVVFTPDKGKISDTAKKIKSALIDLLIEEADIIKKIPVDDFIRALPSGAGRITQRKRVQ